MNVSQTPSRTDTKTIAVFDFDGTLVENDSFIPFLSFVGGWPRTLAALSEAGVLFARLLIKTGRTSEDLDYRGFIKAHLLKRILHGVSRDSLKPAQEKLCHWMRWKDGMHKRALKHRALGHHIVVASGGLDLYLPELLRDLPHDALICTEVGIENGVLTGEMVMGNCVRTRKAERVAEYLRKEGPFEESWGYGNLPHDLPMLQLLKHRIIV